MRLTVRCNVPVGGGKVENFAAPLEFDVVPRVGERVICSFPDLPVADREVEAVVHHQVSDHRVLTSIILTPIHADRALARSIRQKALV